MAFDNTKAHVELNTVPYQIRGYQRSELNTFIPRLGAGEQRESQFDLLRSKTMQGFTGGQLQRFWEQDDTSVFAVEGMYPVYEDGALYPVNTPTVASGLLSGSKSVMTAYATSDSYVYVASRTYNAPTNRIVRIDKSGTQVVMTLPASLTNASAISSMAIWNGQLWVCASLTDAMWYMALTSTTLIDITSGIGGASLLCVFKGQLYATDGGSSNNAINRYTGTTSSRSFVQVATTGQSTVSYGSRFFKYNNRIFLTRHDGLYAFDGTLLVTIEDAFANVDTNNYLHVCVLKGYMYYFMPDGWYRFNGSLIEKLYDIAEIGMPVYSFVGKNRIWLMYRNSSLGSSRYDKAMGYDYVTGDNVDGRVAVFNGKGMYTYGRTTTWVKNTGTEDFAGQGELINGFWFNDKVYLLENYEKTTGNEYFTISTAETTATGNKSWRIISSIFDGEFPMIDKNLDNLEFVFDGNVSSDQTITLEYRTAGFDGSTGWTTFGTISTQTEVMRKVWKTISAGVSFKKIQFRFSGTTAATYGISRVVVRYTLAPDYKNQWQFTVLCYGDDSLAPLMQSDDTESALSVQTLRGNIYTARHSDIPFKFIDVDQLDLNGALTNVTTSVVLNSTVLLKGDNGFIQIDDEIMYWSAKTSTTLTVVRGVLGSIAATHADNAKVFVVYRVLIRQIQNEHIELTNNEPSAEDKSRPSEISLVLQEV